MSNQNPPFASKWGVNSPVYEEEWQAYLRRREEMLKEIQGRLNLSLRLQETFPETTDEARFGLADALFTSQRARELQNPQKYSEVHGIRQRDLNELAGRASRYRPDATFDDLRTMQPDELQRIIMEGRDQAREERQEKGYSAKDEARRGAGTILGGAVDVSSNIIQTIPFLGDALAKRKGVQDYDSWAAKFEEGFRADVFEDEELAYGLVRGGGKLAGYLLPGAVTWRLAGPMTGAITSVRYMNRLSPLAKTALQGSLATAMLEGGGDAPWEERAAIIAAGGGLTAAGSVIIPRFMGLMDRLDRSFATRWSDLWRTRSRGLTTLDDNLGTFGDSPMQGGTARGRPVGETAAPGWEPPARQRALPPWIEPTPGGSGAAASGPTPPAPSAPFAPTTPLGRDIGGMPGAGVRLKSMSNAKPVATMTRQELGETLRALRNMADQLEQRGLMVSQSGRDMVNRVRDDIRIVEEAHSAALGPVATPDVAVHDPRTPPFVAQPSVAPAVAVAGAAQEAISDPEPDWATVGPTGKILRNTQFSVSNQGFNFPDRQGNYIGTRRGQLSAEFTDRHGNIGMLSATVRPDLKTGKLAATVDIMPLGQNTLDLGPAQVRDIGRELVHLLRGMGENVELVMGERITGAHAEWANRAGESPLVVSMSADRLALQDAINLTKQASIAESPRAADMAGQARFDDADVGLSVWESNPGGVSVVRGVGDPAKTVAKMVRESQGRLMPHQIRVIETPRGSDILVSEGQAITNKMVNDYKQHGFFAGQRVLTQEGLEMFVEAPGEVTTLKSPHSGLTYKVWASDVMPGRYAAAGVELGETPAPALYNEFRQWASDLLADEFRAAGQRVADWTDLETTTQLPRLVDQYLDAKSITHPVTRAVVSNYFNVRRVEDFKNLVPQEDLARSEESIRRATSDIQIARASNRLAPAGLDEIAAAKGFTLSLDPSGRFKLRDSVTDWETVMTEDEALEFLNTVNRELPGVMEPTSVPEEMLPTVPGASHLGSSVDPVVTERMSDNAIDIDDIRAMAKFDEGRVGAAMDKSLIRKLGAKMYEGDLSRVIVKEGMQNSIDAIRGVENGRVILDIDSYEKSFTVSDNGKGMSPEVMANEFMDPGGSYKEAGASGGFGLAKVGLFSNAEEIVAVSTWADKSGQLHTTHVEGSGADWMAGQMTYKTEPAARGTETGTDLRLRIDPDAEMDFGQARDFLEKFLKYNKTGHQISAKIDGNKVRTDYDLHVFNELPDEIVNVPGADMEFWISAGFNQKAYGVDVVVLNNGLFQYSTYHPVYPAMAMPEQLVLNVKATVDTEHTRYPFTTNREALSGAANKALDTYIQQLKLGGTKQDISDLVNALRSGAPVEASGGRWKVFSDDKSIPQDEAVRIASRDYTPTLMAPIEEAILEVAYLGHFRFPEIEMPIAGGLGLSKDYLGVNIRMSDLRDLHKRLLNEATQLGIDHSTLMSADEIPQENVILFNPFQSASDVMQGSGSGLSEYWNGAEDALDAAAQELAGSTWATIVHEVSHQHGKARGHGQEFSDVYTRMQGVVAHKSSEVLPKLEAAWKSTLLDPKFQADYEYMKATYYSGYGQADNVFKKISGHLRTEPSSVSGSGDGQGRSGLAPSSDEILARQRPNAGDVPGSEPPFLQSGAQRALPPGAYSGSVAAAGGGSGGGASVPPFTRPGGGLGPGSGEPVGQFRRRGPLAAQALNNYVTDGVFRWMNQTYHAMRKLDSVMQDVLGGRVGLADQYTAVSTGWTKMRNDMSPWMHEAEEILVRFNRSRVRTGELAKVMEIGDQNQMIDTMTRQNFKPDERQAVYDLRDFLDRFFGYMVADPAYKVQNSDYIFGYVSHVRARQMGDPRMDPYEDTGDILPKHLKFFAEEARRGQLDFREMHMGNILGKLIRGAMFHKHVRPAWEAMAETWDQPGIPEQVRAFIGGFLKFVHQGRDPKDDAVLVSMRHVLNRIGVPATDHDIAGLSGGLMGAMYRSYLGLRPDVLLREMMQPGMAASKIGFDPIINFGYRPFFGGGEQKAAMIRRAIEKGWVEPGVPRGVYAGAFEESPMTLSTGELASGPFYTQGQVPQRVASEQKLAERREAWNKFIDTIHDMLPNRAKQGITDTGLDPLFFYGKTTSSGKVIAGNAAYENAMYWMGKYREGQVNIDEMHEILGSAYYGRPMRQKFDDLLNQGDLDGAATRYANDVVADAMLKTGGHEQPAGLRETNIIGRLGFMFGTFTIGTLGWLASGLKSGPKAAAKFTGRYGALIGALAGAEAASGFKFSRWLYHDALLWAGGPMVEGVLNTVQAFRGIGDLYQERKPSAGEMEAMRSFNPTTLLPTIAGAVFPYSGGVRTVSRVLEGFEGPNATYYNTRFLVTGERPNTAVRSDLFNMTKQQGRQIDQSVWRPGDPVRPNESPDTIELPPFLRGSGAIQ
jgi:hypothetical protein